MVVCHIRRNALKLGTQNDILKSKVPIHLATEYIWESFRAQLHSIYATKTGVGARQDAVVATKKRSGKKTVGRKEGRKKSNQNDSRNLPTPAASIENTQVSQSSNFSRYTCLIVATFTASASSPEEKRQISQSSTLSKSIDSVGGGLVLCTNEINTSHMVNAFMTGLMGMWRRSAILEFIPPHVRQLSLEFQYADP